MEEMLLTTKYLRARRIMLATASALSLAACAPTLGAMPSLVGPSQLESSHSFDAPRAAWPSDAWWEAYGNAQLNALIEEGLPQSPSLAAAAARLAQAQASLQQTGALNGPSINAEGAAQSARQNATGLPSTLTSALPRGADLR